MNILFLGDIMGQAGRKAVQDYLPSLKTTYALDFVIANGENAAHGFGITNKLSDELCALGIDVITTGNHIWDQKDLVQNIHQNPRLLRPLNYPKATPGRGMALYPLPDGRQVAVLNVMGRLFMDPLDDPFAAADNALTGLELSRNVAAIVVDIHAEASSEKQVMGCMLDGRVSLVVGTHTHVPTADARVLPNGTGFMTDAGMCGDYDSIIGMRKDIAVAKMVRKLPTERLAPATGSATLCGVLVTLDNRSGLCQSIKPIRLGGKLQETS